MSNLRRLAALLSALVLLPVLAVTTSPSRASASVGDDLFKALNGFALGKSDEVRVRPADYTAYRVDLAALRDQLAGSTATLDIPDPAGTLTGFTVVEDSVMEPELQAAHPEIRTYAGAAADGSSIRLDVTPLGFHAFVRRPDGVAWYVDPAYQRVGEDRVLSYAGAALPQAPEAFAERELEPVVDQAVGQSAASGDQGFAAPGGTVSQRIFRLAFLTDQTYAQEFGTTNVLAEKAIMINRVNEVYNDDLAIKFVLINGTDTKLNLDTDAKAIQANGPCGANPCFTTDELASCSGDTLTRNEFVLGQLVGADSFDIGHIGLGVNGGGIAGLGVVGGASKADGCTGLPTPDGDFYAIDYVAHEMGHQMGGDHTFNGTQLNCATGNRNVTPYATQVEPGSGSSVMAYAGICQQDNLQPHSDPYFSFASVDEINATTSASPSSVDEEQVVNLAGFDGTDSFTLSCTGCPISATIANGSSYNALQLSSAISTATGQTVTPLEVTGYDGGGAPAADGFTVDFSVLGSGVDVPTLTVQPVSGTFTSFTGTVDNGGPATNQGTVTVTANHAPVVTAPADKTIPIRTPFTLAGSGTDPDGDTLTYLWEQTDAGGLTGTALTSNTKTDGPLFRMFGTAAQVSSTDTLTYHSPGENLAGTSPSRTFPDLAQVVAGNTNAKTGACPAPPAAPASGGATNVPAATIDCYSEFLPTADYNAALNNGRVLNFRLTARDEFTPDVSVDDPGGLSSDNVALTVNQSAGPFLVTSRGTVGQSTASAALEDVTWAVNGTNTAALATNVKISLSTDGGVTFPTVLAASTPNDGAQQVQLPAVNTSTARLKVEAVGNYFFAVNDANFTIGAPLQHLGDGKGKFNSPKKSSKSVKSAKGKAKFRFSADFAGTTALGSASFKFKKGKVAFTGTDVSTSTASGKRLNLIVAGTNKGKAGYTLVIAAKDGGARDKIRIRLLKGTKVVYDSMPGKPAAKGPRTKIKGQIRVG